MKSNFSMDNIAKIKRWTLIAMFSDDELMDRLVLKGGNAIDLIYGMEGRYSKDIDLSMRSTFDDIGLKGLQGLIEKVLVQTFREQGYLAFDIILAEKPSVIDDNLRGFWGGYTVEFKVIERERADGKDLEALRREATVIGENQERKFSIDISKHEFVEGKKATVLDGYTIYVYTPEMIVFEKLRAICQQMPEYAKLVNKSYQTPRARDFYDIYKLCEKYHIDPTEKDNPQLIRHIFSAKKVPLLLIGKIEEQREYHRTEWSRVEGTVKIGEELNEFDFYFDYVIKFLNSLKSLGVEEFPS